MLIRATFLALLLPTLTQAQAPLPWQQGQPQATPAARHLPPTDAPRLPTGEPPAIARLSEEARSLYFGFSSAALTAREAGKLNAIARAVKASPEVESVDVIGHTDPIGSVAVNRALSQKRSEAVARALNKRGVRVREVGLTGIGAMEPKVRCAESLPRPERIRCLSADRRVEVRFNLR